jgi:hypothetical protein
MLILKDNLNNQVPFDNEKVDNQSFSLYIWLTILIQSKMGKAKFYGIVTGISATLIAAGYFLAISALPRVDNPSSTQGVAYVFMIIYTVFAGLIGIVAGSLLGWAIDSIILKTGLVENENKIKKLVCSILIGGLIIVSIAKYLNTKSSQEKFNLKNTQEVKFSNGNIEKNKFNISELRNYNLDLNIEHAIGRIGAAQLGAQKEFVWNGKDYIISSDENNHFLIKNPDGTVFIDHSLEGYNYITGISFLVYDKNEKSYLFILTRLRATSHMSVLNVFSEKGELLYEELMGRYNIIESGELNGEKVIIIGNSQPRENEIIVSLADFIYSIKD